MEPARRKLKIEKTGTSEMRVFMKCTSTLCRRNLIAQKPFAKLTDFRMERGQANNVRRTESEDFDGLFYFWKTPEHVPGNVKL